jgi:hypothetical protein
MVIIIIRDPEIDGGDYGYRSAEVSRPNGRDSLLQL